MLRMFSTFKSLIAEATLVLALCVVSTHPNSVLAATFASSSKSGTSSTRNAAASCALPPGTAIPEGTSQTLLTTTVSESGSVTDVTIFRSSGNHALDEAALECSRQTRPQPVLVDDKPAKVTGIEAYYWNRKPPVFRTRQVLGEYSSTCHYPRSAVVMREYGRTVVTFTIATDGTVKNVAVMTSATPSLDAAAVACVSGWQYYPMTSHGVPVETNSSVSMNWSVRDW